MCADITRTCNIIYIKRNELGVQKKFSLSKQSTSSGKIIVRRFEGLYQNHRIRFKLNLHHSLISCHGDSYQAGMRFCTQSIMNIIQILCACQNHGSFMIPHNKTPGSTLSVLDKRTIKVNFHIFRVWWTPAHLFYHQFYTSLSPLHRARRVYTTSAVDHNCLLAFALQRASHHEKRSHITFIFASCCKDRIFSTISFAEVDSKRSTRICSMDKAIQHYFTILHFRKQCPPSSSRRQQTRHHVSMSMPLHEILVRNGRLLCPCVRSQYAAGGCYEPASIEIVSPLVDT